MINENQWHINGSSKVRLVSITPNAEEIITYCARVSNPKGQDRPIGGLLKYCLREGHVSVFEQASMTVEIVTPLAISVQILRHRSACYQQFSGRYSDQQQMADLTEFLPTFSGLFYMPQSARLQDTKNRQNSIAVDDENLTRLMQESFSRAYGPAIQEYNYLLDLGISKELARFVLPEGVYTRMFMTGNIRTWWSYLKVRDAEGVAQYEHVEVARAIKEVFKEQLPLIYTTAFGEE